MITSASSLLQSSRKSQLTIGAISFPLNNFFSRYKHIRQSQWRGGRFLLQWKSSLPFVTLELKKLDAKMLPTMAQ